MPVIGYLGSGEATSPTVDMFRRGLGETGYVEGRNVAIESRFADGQYGRLPALAADLVGREVAILVTSGGVHTALAAKAATPTIPILFAHGSDPVKSGLVASLNRPGDNITGVAFLVNQSNELKQAAGALGLQLHFVNVSSEREFDAAFAAIVRMRAGALLVAADPFYFNRRIQLVALAARHSIPAIYDFRAYAEAGGLASYGTDLAGAYRQLGNYAGRVLKGEKPAELPVIQSTRFEFVINLKVAKALGIEVPPTLSARADEVIE